MTGRDPLTAPKLYNIKKNPGCLRSRIIQNLYITVLKSKCPIRIMYFEEKFLLGFELTILTTQNFQKASCQWCEIFS